MDYKKLGQSSLSRPREPQKGARGAGRAKSRVKSGCRTCKIRKVKCDEGRPSCTRCVSTGRVCDGYGVWGGGGRAHTSSSSSSSSSSSPIKPSLVPATPRPTTQDEQCSLEWFRSRTAVKIGGPFVSPFWSTLVLQTGLQEPCVFNAMLALSSAHRRVCIGSYEVGSEAAPDPLEQFTLRQYSKAIGHLLERHAVVVPHERSSIRVALVTCLLFVCLELLRGRYQAGNIHLQNGVKILALLNKDMEQQQEHGAAEGVQHNHTLSNRDRADDWITDAFTRMRLPAVHCGQGDWLPPGKQRSLSSKLPATFASMAQARQSLESFFVHVLHLKRQADRGVAIDNNFATSASKVKSLADIQCRLKAGLTAWLTTYEASRGKLEAQMTAVSRIGYELLFLYYLMACIMADTSLRADDEMAFDSQVARFESLVAHADGVLEAIQAVHATEDPIHGLGARYCLFTADVGWAPPLYYTAIHCRIYRVRVRAIELLRALPSREGVWDSLFAARVAQEVLQVEEEEEEEEEEEVATGRDIFSRGGHALEARPSPDLNLPDGLSSSRRVFDVHVVLPESMDTKVTLTCKRREDDGSCQHMTREIYLDTPRGRQGTG
ncbi:hypothetical protein M406DRAFT_266480 [Cryphonectria parasitica EP155]|uniref:Zn(2)-C6 fungal-type domain-containing protein n=1 Tax=Cryphonectria parasitica (strain ATCC 38755 / EP155) TaxID=660469 RepID=A0A9P4XVJ7_CRYP1|nr:uncharacterized protein M406DRAFT_266480 [Cryphonectria parasitica EP155]KAF3761759.1 hypothetical protein M406DRAFT_266480 [Cryphonectria parasitica EP155]